MTLKTAKVPPQFEEIFTGAEKYVKEHFKKIKINPREGEITIGGERYILIRAKSMSVQFLSFIENLYPELEEEERHQATSSILFDIAHALGKADAEAFHLSQNVVDPVEKLSSGPIHFAYSGWAYVDISSDSNPSPDNNFYLLYDHPYSFESDSWIRMERASKYPVCHMNAGYSSGWCEQSFGIELTAREISCRAVGHTHCRFIMSHPSRIDEFVQAYKDKHQ